MAFGSTLSVCIFFGLIFAASTSDVNTSAPNATEVHDTGEHSEHHGIEIAGIKFQHVREPLIYTVVVILAALSKVGFHHLTFLSSKIPESCLLIILGLLFGVVIEYTGASAYMPEFFSPHHFFQFLLPPIILESAFSLHDRTFSENIGSVLLFAVIGTILAFFTLGLTLWGLAKGGAMGAFPFEISLIQILIFAALIVAVDPVAVLAVFQEVGVNNVLYFMVFGESLLNDGVTVVLYQVMQTYNGLSSSGQAVDGEQIGLGIVKFLVVCLGGLALGIIAGVVTAILTKYTRHVKIAQPIIVFTMFYLGFLLSELFEFSGIISIIACGLVQVQYAFHNISDKSRTTITYFTKVISNTNEIIIFLFLGLAMIRKKRHMWHTGFVLWTVVFCLLYRFIITFFLSFLINKFDNDRTRMISYDEQFMIAYGGLRGAVCFSLVALLDENALPPGMKDMFETATLVVIFFTVFVQGTTIKPLVKLFKVKLAQKKQLSMYEDINEHLTDHLMAGIEEIVGFRGSYALKEELEHFEDRYIRKYLQLEPELGQTQLQEYYHKILLKEHYKHLELGGVAANPADHIPRIETKLYIAPENGPEHHAHGAVTVPEKPKKQKEKTKDIDAYGLSGLLNMHQGASALHRKWDKNLTQEHHGNFANHIQRKTAKNRAIQSLQMASRRPSVTSDQIAASGTKIGGQGLENPVFELDDQIGPSGTRNGVQGHEHPVFGLDDQIGPSGTGNGVQGHGNDLTVVKL